MPSTVLVTHGCSSIRDLQRSRNSSAATPPWIPRRLASSLSSRRVSSNLVSVTTNFNDDTNSTPRLNAAVRMPPLPRKKSGEPLKSSLKLKRTPSWGSLTVITDPVNSSSPKSAPATLAHKGVRFHSQLEHVKLFLAKQKPLAVSRDGNLTDTSGTESEVPPLIYAHSDDLKERPLVMHHIDVPTAPSLSEDTRDVVVENIDLVGTTIEGIVRVRNLAFEKWITVRFTLDKWQTISEVTARYKESLPDGTFDRFMFTIKLADVLSRAEEKTLYLAVRYSVAGREIWDNNSGRNYQVQVVREKAPEVNEETVVESREVPSQAGDIVDLRRKLEQVVKRGCPSDTTGSILAQESRHLWDPPSPTPSPPRRDATPSFRSEDSLAARYDIAASLRTPLHPPAAQETPSHARTSTHSSARPNSVLWLHSQTLHSPCDSPPPDTDEISSLFPNRDTDSVGHSDDENTAPSLLPHRSSGSGSRNHTRGGSIDPSDAPSVKRSPPTSPFGSPVSLPLPTFAAVRPDVNTPTAPRRL
jgi:hypothetical protein